MCIYVLSAHLVRGTTNKSNSEISGDDAKKQGMALRVCLVWLLALAFAP
jgi:hypothetical protein